MNDQSVQETFDAYTMAPGNEAHPEVNTVEDVIVYKLARLVAITQRMGQGWTDAMFRVSLNEWRLLGLVHVHEPVRAGDLAALMLMDKSQLSRIIRGLVSMNYVKSSPDKDDARAVALKMTRKGRELHTLMLAEAERRSRAFFASLDQDEMVELVRLIGKLTDDGLERIAELDAYQG